MVEQTVIIGEGVGLHARPAAQLVRAAVQYQCTVRLRTNAKEADGKSVLAIIGLDATPGTTVTVRTEGPDEQEALAHLVKLLQGD